MSNTRYDNVCATGRSSMAGLGGKRADNSQHAEDYEADEGYRTADKFFITG